MKRIYTILFLFLLHVNFQVCAAEQAKIELTDGQYRITGTTYSAIVPPTGLLGFLKVGDKVMIDTPLDLCIGNEWNAKTRSHICANIIQSEPGVLLCDGPDATLSYQFNANGFTIKLTGKAEKGTRLFANLNELLEGAWTDGQFLGPHRHAANSRSGDYNVKTAKLLYSGQVMSVERINAFYGPALLRWDAPRGQSVISAWNFGPATPDELKLFAVGSIYSEALTVLSPMDYQVFQRQTAKEGRIRIAGRFTGDGDKLEYRMGDGKWTELGIDKQTGNFAAEFNVSAGGWYRCEIRITKDGKEIALKVIEHVGVGEVFVAAGQSNSTNGGEKKLKSESGMVSTFSGELWRLADDPQPGVHDNSGGGSFYPPLGDLLYEKFKVPVAFAVTGHGGSSVAQWQAGGELFNWMEMRIQQLGPQGFRAVLWHQGEADATTLEQEYYDRLKTIIEQSNLLTGWSFPWMVAQVGGGQTRKAKERLWSDGVALEGPDSDALRGLENRISKTNGHFNEAGLNRHAALWAEKLETYLKAITEKQ